MELVKVKLLSLLIYIVLVVQLVIFKISYIYKISLIAMMIIEKGLNMDNLFVLFKYLGSAFIQICSMQFYIFGYPVSYGSAFIFAGLASLVIWFLTSLSE